MPGHGLGKFCNISRLGMASATNVDVQCLGMASASSPTFHAWAWPRRPLAEEPQWARRIQLVKSLIQMARSMELQAEERCGYDG